MIKLSTNHNTFLVKHATYQKVESLKATSLSKLENIVNSNSIFNTNVLNSLQSGRCSFIFTTTLVYATIPTVFTKNPLPHFSYFSPPYSTLTCS